jgi:hypothetical protein
MGLHKSTTSNLVFSSGSRLYVRAPRPRGDGSSSPARAASAYRPAAALRTILIFLPLAVLACQRDAPAPGERPAGSSASAGAAGPSSGCSGLAEHWRQVWTSETPPGLERRRTHAITRVVAMWGDACAAIAKEPAQDLQPALDELRAVRTFAAIEEAARSNGTPTKRQLARSIQDAAARTKSAYAVAPAGVDECEEAIASAAFCGDEVDKAAVKSAAGGKDDGACAALSVLLTKKCAQQ